MRGFNFLQVESGYIIFLKTPPEIMRESIPDVICPGEERSVLTSADSKKHFDRMIAGSKKIVSVHKVFMAAVHNGEQRAILPLQFNSDIFLTV